MPISGGDEPPVGNIYLHHSLYWVPAAEADAYPVRQGDLFAEATLADGSVWEAAVIVQPTCELGKPSVAHVQVAHVRALEVLPDISQRMLVQAGFRERDGRDADGVRTHVLRGAGAR